ncbi:MAG: DedA family protein [Verrucomicrobiales bacterium]|nr:DedA family protein [Verrucomicrobiales bacterium]
METIHKLWSYVGHINTHLDGWVSEYGVWVYGILFLIIFCETGLVVMPFLPGDSLLFALGAICARANSTLNIWLVSLTIVVAALLGDSLNYSVGRQAGAWLQRKFPRVVKPQHMARTHAFFVKYGGKTIIMARFVPLVRTFAPFVAGTSRMGYRKFISYSVAGALLWVGTIVPAGYLLGSKKQVQDNFELVVVGIIIISLIPAVIGWLKARAETKRLDAIPPGASTPARPDQIRTVDSDAPVS